MAVVETLLLASLAVASNEGAIKPFDLAVAPNVMAHEMLEYDFTKQQRFNGSAVQQASWTMNSIQTFNYQGQPSDATSDSFDLSLIHI